MQLTNREMRKMYKILAGRSKVKKSLGGRIVNKKSVNIWSQLGTTKSTYVQEGE
jgi:hypothetical protein